MTENRIDEYKNAAKVICRECPQGICEMCPIENTIKKMEEENIWEADVRERRIVATIIVNDAKAIEEDIGPIEYLENMFSDIQEMGEFDVYLENAKVIDDDDPYDTKVIKMVDKIFNDDVDDYED